MKRPSWWSKEFALVFNANFWIMGQNYYLAPLIPLILAQQGLSMLQISLVSAIMIIPSGIARLLSGWLCDGIGLRQITAASFTLLGLVALSYSMIDSMSLSILLLIAVAHAIAQCSASTSVNALLNQISPEDYRARIAGYAGMLGFLSMPLFQPISMALANVSHVLWGVVIGVLTLSTLSLWSLKRDERRHYPLKWNELFDRKTFYWGMTSFGAAWAHGAISTLIPIYAVKELQLSSTQIWCFFAVYAGAILVSRWIAGKLADNHVFLPLYFSSISLTFVGLLALALLPNIWGVLAGGCFVGLGYPMNHQTASKLANMKADPARVGKTNATYWLVYEMAMLAGKASLFLLIWLNYSQMWLAISIGLLLSVGVVIGQYKQKQFA
jgi:MFS family permease